MTEEKMTGRLILLLLAVFLLGISFEYAYMDKVMQYESVGYFSYSCDLIFGEENWQVHRVSYNVWECTNKTAPIIQEVVNISELDYNCLKEGLCNRTQISSFP
jgi:hypothetical protein